MASSYPGALDVLANPDPNAPMNDPANPHSTQHANANDAIEAIQSTLGVNPQGGYATVEDRIKRGLLKVVSYDGGTNNTFATTNTAQSSAGIYTEDLTLTVTAPTTELMLEFTTPMVYTSTSNWVYWYLLDAGNSYITNSEVYVSYYTSSYGRYPVSARWHLTGLTAGGSYTFKPCRRTNTGTVYTYVGTAYGEAVFTAWAL